MLSSREMVSPQMCKMQGTLNSLTIFWNLGRIIRRNIGGEIMEAEAVGYGLGKGGILQNFNMCSGWPIKSQTE